MGLKRWLLAGGFLLYATLGCERPVEPTRCTLTLTTPEGDTVVMMPGDTVRIGVTEFIWDCYYWTPFEH